MKERAKENGTYSSDDCKMFPPARIFSSHRNLPLYIQFYPLFLLFLIIFLHSSSSIFFLMVTFFSLVQFSLLVIFSPGHFFLLAISFLGHFTPLDIFPSWRFSLLVSFSPGTFPFFPDLLPTKYFHVSALLFLCVK